MEVRDYKEMYPDEDTENYAIKLSVEFMRDSRRYCRVLTTEVEE